MVSGNHGWATIVKNLRRDLAVYGCKLNMAVEDDYGMPVFSASPSENQEIVNKILDRARDIAMETCSICGEYGELSFRVTPPASGIRCDKHRGDWQTL